MKKIKLFCFILSILVITKGVFANELPSCNDKAFVQRVVAEINTRRDDRLKRSSLNIRFSKLLTKHSEIMEEVEISSFENKISYSIADKIMELKVNNNYKNDDMRLCKSIYNKAKEDFFTLSYNDEEKVFVYIVSENENGEENQKKIEY